MVTAGSLWLSKKGSSLRCRYNCVCDHSSKLTACFSRQYLAAQCGWAR